MKPQFTLAASGFAASIHNPWTRYNRNIQFDHRDPNGTDELLTKIDKGVTDIAKRQTDLEKQHKSDNQKVLDDLDRSDKEVKKAMDELTTVKNKVNSSHEEVMQKMAQVQRQVALNARSSFRSPIARALADDQTRCFLNAISRMLMVKSEADYKRIPAEMRKVLEEAQAETKSLTGVDGGIGQATVPTQTFDVIYDTLLEYGQWATLGVQRVGMRTTVLPVTTARPQFYWIGAGTGVAEGSGITPGNFNGGSVSLIIQTLAAYLLVSRELLADSTVDLAPYLLRELVQAVSYGLDWAAFAATGNADQTDAGYYGIFSAGSVNTNQAAAATAGNTTVAALDLEDFVRCLTTVSAAVLMRSPKWWVHPQVLATAVLIRDKNGRPIFQTWQEVPTPGAIGSILGFPVVPTAAAPTAANTTAGSPAFAFGDPEGQVVGIRSDLELATSDDIKFAENMRAFRVLMRAGTKMRTLAASNLLKPFAILTTAAA